MNKTISIIIPAFNEELNIRKTAESVIRASQEFADYEILVFNDCSTDKTGILANELSKTHPKIKVIHNQKNMGFAYNYKEGIKHSQNEYIAIIPGDNEISEDSIMKIFAHVGKADIIIPYAVNYSIRPIPRQILSKLFTYIFNSLFNLNLKYFNGPVVHKKEHIQAIQINSDSFAFQAEVLVKLIKSGHSYVEVGIILNRREHGKSKALKIKNIFGVLKTTVQLKKSIVP